MPGLPLLKLSTKDANSKQDTPDPSLYGIIIPLIDEFVTFVSSLEDSIRVDSMQEVRWQVHLLLTDKMMAYETHTIKSISEMFFSQIDTVVSGRGDKTPLSSEQSMSTGGPNFDVAFEYLLSKNKTPNGIWHQVGFLLFTLQNMYSGLSLADNASRSSIVVFNFASLIVLIIRNILQARSTWDTKRGKIGMVVAFIMDIFGYAAIGVACIGYQEVESFFNWITTHENSNQGNYLMGQTEGTSDHNAVWIFNEVKAWSVRYMNPDARQFVISRNGTITTTKWPEYIGVKALDVLIAKYLQHKGVDNKQFRFLIKAAMSFLTKYKYPVEDITTNFDELRDIQLWMIAFGTMYVVLRAFVYATLQEWSYRKEDIQTEDMNMRHSGEAEWKPNEVIKQYNKIINLQTDTAEVWGKISFDLRMMTLIFTQNGHIFEDYLGKHYDLVKAQKDLEYVNIYTSGMTCAAFTISLIDNLKRLTVDTTQAGYYDKWRILYTWISVMTSDVNFRVNSVTNRQNGDKQKVETTITPRVSRRRFPAAGRQPEARNDNQHFWPIEDPPVKPTFPPFSFYE